MKSVTDKVDTIFKDLIWYDLAPQVDMVVRHRCMILWRPPVWNNPIRNFQRLILERLKHK